MYSLANQEYQRAHYSEIFLNVLISTSIITKGSQLGDALK